jgi:AcrR family transcriptional regulator
MKPTKRPAATPTADLPPLAVPRVLPRGVNSLPQEVVLVSQRSRIVEATAEAVAHKGYADTTVADIIGLAGVSRTTFYQLYKDKEDCFLACFEAMAQAHHEVTWQALSGSASAPERLIAGLGAYMRRVDSDAAFARAFIGEAEAATPLIREAFMRAQGRLEDSLKRWFDSARREHPEIREPSAPAFALVNAGMGAFVVNCVRTGQPLTSLVPEIAAFLFAGLSMPAWADHARRVLAE